MDKMKNEEWVNEKQMLFNSLWFYRGVVLIFRFSFLFFH